jgi:DNA topoisomerase II
MPTYGEYEQVDEISHVLLRPGMYIGGPTKATQVQCWGLHSGGFTEKDRMISPLLIKAFEEILANAVDNAFKNDQCTEIHIDVDPSCHRAEIYNDFCSIPIHKQEDGIYLPAVLFGKLRSSGNYRDDNTRISAGLNGLGCKLTNIFSKQFEVCIWSGTERYEQRFSDNMRCSSEPVITADNRRSGIRVQYELDPTHAPQAADELSIIAKLAIDASQAVRSTKVFFNGRLIDYTAVGYGRLYSDFDAHHLYSGNGIEVLAAHGQGRKHVGPWTPRRVRTQALQPVPCRSACTQD